MFETLKEISFIQTLISGGPVMVPLLLCSLAALAVVIERLFWGPTKEKIVPSSFQQQARSLIAQGRMDELLGLCRADGSALARMLFTAIMHRNRSRAEIIESMEVIGRKEAFSLQQRLGILGTVAAASPLLGLLGTVFGMISTFHVISAHGTGNPAMMADGIAEALITTATGLTIAVPALLFYRYFLHQTRTLIVEMESAALSLLDELVSHQQSREEQPQRSATDAVQRLR